MMTGRAARHLHLTWHRLRDGSPGLAGIYLDVASELLPALVPSRFGTHEPRQGRFPRDDAATFDRMYREECEISELFFTGRTIPHGAVSGWTNDLEARYQRLSIRIDPELLGGAVAQGALEEFFIEVAKRSESFFASAELNDTMFETAQAAPVRGAWAGLPPQPQWLTWYSPEYAELVETHLSAGETRKFPEGWFHRWTDEPADAAEILTWIWEDSWLPQEMLPAPNPGNTRRPHEQAHIMPESLRAPAQGSPEWRRIEAHYARDVSPRVQG